MKSNPTDPYTGENAPVPKGGCRLRLVPSTDPPAVARLRIAFASADRQRVDQHFGAAEGFVVYDVDAERAALVGVGAFPGTAMDGNESKLAAKIDFLAGCAAVFVLAVGTSAIQQLLAHGIQPIRVAETDGIEALVAEISAAIRSGGVPWVDRALSAARRADRPANRFAAMEAEGWSD